MLLELILEKYLQKYKQKIAKFYYKDNYQIYKAF